MKTGRLWNRLSFRRAASTKQAFVEPKGGPVLTNFGGHLKGLLTTLCQDAGYARLNLVHHYDVAIRSLRQAETPSVFAVSANIY